MAIDRIPGVGPQNSDIATAVAAPSAATITSSVLSAGNSAGWGATGGKNARYETLLSGSSWTVPAGVTYVNATLTGGGGQGGGGSSISGRGPASYGLGGQVIVGTVATTPGASISYSIGSGGSGAGFGNSGNPGGSTTFTGVTSAAGGAGGVGAASGAGITGTNGNVGSNGGTGGTTGGTNNTGGPGGSGSIILEYFLQNGKFNDEKICSY